MTRYQVKEPEDGLWGLEGDGGNWTGIVGTLQHEKADFSMDLTLTQQRAEVIQFCRVYIDEDIIIMSSKPQPLPEYLSLFRPFEGSVWALVVGSVIAWSVALWISMKWSVSGPYLDFTNALFYGWGLLLEDNPFRAPSDITGKIMDPYEGMKKILGGGFSYICNYYVAITLVTSQYNELTDGVPIHISSTKYPLFAGNTWAFRPGMLSMKQFDKTIQQFLDSGLVSYWMDNVIEEHSRKKRLQVNNADVAKIDQSVVVLGLPHLQTTFYGLLLCYAAALVFLFIEHLFHNL